MSGKSSATHSSLRPSLPSLARLLDFGSPRSWAFLAGSGISVPSGLPTAWDFNERISDFLGNSTAERRQISSLLATGKHHTRQTLRFEQVIEILREIGGDKDLVVLDIFDAPGPPTDLHFFLAGMLKRGSVVMTTNFDSLIERAFLSTFGKKLRSANRLLQIHLESDRSPRSRSTFRWYAKQRKLGTAVLKLHGTLRTLATERVTGAPSFDAVRARASIGATLDALGRAVTSPGLEPMKNKVLRRVLHGRTLCVLGYSGSDDFDVLPSLAGASGMIENILWVRHSLGRIRINVSSHTASVGTMLPGVMATVPWRGQVVVVEGNTLDIVRSLFGAAAIAIPVEAPVTATTMVRNFETVPPYVGMTSSRKQTLRGYLEETALVLQAAQRTYARATIQAKQDRDLRSEVFSQARLGQLARVNGRLEDAARFLGRAQKRLSDFNSDHRLAATVFLASGNVSLDQTAWRSATEAYRKAIAYARRARWLGMEATALNNLGLVHRRQGHLALARRYILRALKLDQRLRRRSAIARDLGNLGIIAHELGNFRDALRYGKQAMSLDQEMGNNATLATKRIDIAFALLRLRRYTEAVKEIKSALRLAQKYGRREDEARCLSVHGLLHWQQGHFALSVNYHKRALSIFRSIGRREAIAHELMELGIAYRSANERTEAKQCVRESIKLFRAVRNYRMVRMAERELNDLKT